MCYNCFRSDLGHFQRNILELTTQMPTWHIEYQSLSTRKYAKQLLGYSG